MQSRRGGTWSTSAAVLAGNVAVTLTQLVVFALFGRFVGTEALGAYSLCLAISTPLFTATGLSLRNLAVTSPEAWSPRSYLSWAAAVGGVATVMSVLVAVVLGAPVLLLLAVCVVKALDNATFATIGLLQRRGRLTIASASLVSNALVTGLAGTVAVLLGHGTAGILAASVLGSVCPLVLCLVLVARSPSEETHGPARLRTLLARGLPLSGGSAIVAFTTAMPVYFLGSSSQLAVAAAYGVLSNVRGGLSVPFIALAQVGIGQMSVCFRARDVAGMRRSYRRTFVAVTVCAGAAGVFLLAAGELAMSLVFHLDIDHGRQAMLALTVTLVLVAWVFAVDARMQAVQAYSAQLPSSLVSLVVTVVILWSFSYPITLVAALYAVTAGLTASLILKWVWTRLAVRGFEAAARP